jgi:hypothetical protein
MLGPVRGRGWFRRSGEPLITPRRLYLADGENEAHVVANTYLDADQPMVETACGQLEPGPGRMFDEGAVKVDVCYACTYPAAPTGVPDD